MSKRTANIVPALPSRLYDWGRKFSRIVLPAFGALYFGLSQIWGFPHGEEVVGTCSLLTVFLTALLGMAKATYEESEKGYGGDLVFGELGDKPEMLLNQTPESFYGQDKVTFKVKRTS